jgi:hypothetical protein
MASERGFDEVTFQAGGGEPVTVWKSLLMREQYGAVLRDGPTPEVWYETTHNHARLSFDHTADRPHKVKIVMNDEFAYEDLVEFMTFFTVLSGWLGRAPRTACSSPSD